MKRKFWIALLLCLCICLTVSTVSAESAAPPEDYRSGPVIDSGSCGADVTWTLYDNCTLVFSGTGKTEDYDENHVGNWVNNKEYVVHVVFEEGITEIGDYLLNNFIHMQNRNIRTITIPSTVTKIGEDAFTWLKNLEAVNISDLARWCAIDFANTWSNPMDNQAALYLNGVLVENLEIPENVTVLKDSAFKGCTSLRSVFVHENVTRIGSYAFNTCENLETVYFTGSAPGFGEAVFTLSDPVAWYPADDPAWAEVITPELGEEVTWIPYKPMLFTDVSFGSFYYDSVMWAVKQGITNGVSATTFGPGQSCNRAQVVTFLWRAAGSPEPAAAVNAFVDVEAGSFYEKAVLWAVEKGVTNGTDATHFSPGVTCNRATVVTFLYRAFESPAVENAENPFADIPAESWYTAPVLWAVEQSVTNGLSADSFGPDQSCNRAQIVTFLHRAYTE